MFTQVQAQEEAGHPGARVTGGYKLPNVGAENQTQALRRAVHLPSCWVEKSYWEMPKKIQVYHVQEIRY